MWYGVPGAGGFCNALKCLCDGGYVDQNLASPEYLNLRPRAWYWSCMRSKSWTVPLPRRGRRTGMCGVGSEEEADAPAVGAGFVVVVGAFGRGRSEDEARIDRESAPDGCADEDGVWVSCVTFGFGVAAVSSPRLEPGLNDDAASACCCCCLCRKGIDVELAEEVLADAACFVLRRFTESVSLRGSVSSFLFDELAPLTLAPELCVCECPTRWCAAGEALLDAGGDGGSSGGRGAGMVPMICGVKRMSEV